MKPSTMMRPWADAPAGHGVVPGLLHVGRAVDLALALAGAAHHGLDDARVADAGVNRGLQLGQRVTELVGAGGQAQGLGGQAADAFAVHGQARGPGGGNHAHHAGGLQHFEHGRGDGLDLGHDQVGFVGLDQRAQQRGVAHGDGARVVRHLLAGGVVVAIHRDGFHAQALQGDQDFLAQLAGAEQHDFGGREGKRGAEGGHGDEVWRDRNLVRIQASACAMASPMRTGPVGAQAGLKRRVSLGQSSTTVEPSRKRPISSPCFRCTGASS
jgi:hypothetical protein